MTITAIVAFGVVAGLTYLTVAGCVMRSLASRWKTGYGTWEWTGAFWTALLWPIAGPMLLGVVLHEQATKPRAPKPPRPTKPLRVASVSALDGAEDYRHCKALVEAYERRLPVHER